MLKFGIYGGLGIVKQVVISDYDFKRISKTGLIWWF
jgi:hypothetical protein